MSRWPSAQSPRRRRRHDRPRSSAPGGRSRAEPTGGRRSASSRAARRPIRRRGSPHSALRSTSSRRVGAADVAAETARLTEAGVTPHLVGDPERPTGRLVALIDPSGERSFFTDRGANEALSRRRHSRRARRRRDPHPPLGLFLLRTVPARRRARRPWPRGRDPGQRRPGVLRDSSRGRAAGLSRLDARRFAPAAERGRSGGLDRLGRSRDPVRRALLRSILWS